YGGELSQLADVGTGDECFVARSRQDDAAHGGVILCILESGPQIFPRLFIQSVEDLGPIKRHIGDRPVLLVQNVLARGRSGSGTHRFALLKSECLGTARKARTADYMRKIGRR